MKIAVCQYYTNNLTYGEYSERINKYYCDKIGYTYICEKDTDKIKKQVQDRAYTWYKPKYILDIFKSNNYDYILFLDIDAVITDFDIKITDIINKYKNYNAYFSDDVGHHSSLNAGVFLIKNTKWSISFLNNWWNLGESLKSEEARDLHISEDNIGKVGYYKNALWHDQTCLTYMYDNDENIKKNIKVLDRQYFNHDTFLDKEFIFHGYAKAFFKNRCLDVVENKLLSNNDKKNINLIVYHVYCYGSWRKLFKKQINRLKKSKLYDWSDVLEICVIGQDDDFLYINNFLKPYKKVKLNNFKSNNFEHESIDIIWNYSQKYTGKVFYFHTKGVYNKYKNFNNNEISTIKRKSIKWWRNIMQYYLVDNFKNCLEELNTKDQCGVSYSNGWWWGNFWWSNLNWISNNGRPNYGDRWYYEAWLNHSRTPSYTEYYKFNFNPYFTYLSSNIYKNLDKFGNKNIKIKFARYGYPIEPENETSSFNVNYINNFCDVTDIVRQNLIYNNYKAIDIDVNNNLFSDPIEGEVKFLHIWIYYGKKIYMISQKEGNKLFLKLK